MSPKQTPKNSVPALRSGPFSPTGLPFGYRVPLFRWKGLVFNADLTVLILFALLILTLRFRLFPFFYANLSLTQYWVMALLTGLGIALSIVAHEMIHVAVAQGKGETPHGLFLSVGGSAAPFSQTKDKRATRTSLYLSGVLFSLVLSAILLALGFLNDTNGRNDVVTGVFVHLSAFNVTLALFQLLPVLPLDGGRFLLNLKARGGALRPWVVTALYLTGCVIGWAFVGVGCYQVIVQRPVLGAWISAMGLLLLRANDCEYRSLTATKG